MQYLKRALYIFLLFKSFLFSSDSIVHNVDVITGRLCLSYTDHVVQGPVSIPIRRNFYTIIDQTKNDNALIASMERIGIFPHLILYINKPRIKYGAEIIEVDSGKTFYRTISEDKKKLVLEYGPVHPDMYCDFPNHGYPLDDNRSHQYGYRNNKKNNRITIYRKEKKAIMVLADGTKRHYTAHGPNRTFKDKITSNYWKIRYQYLLQKEIAPNGEVTLFEYDRELNKSIIHIKKVSPHDHSTLSWIRVETYRKNKHQEGVLLTSSDNTQIFYQTYPPHFITNTSGLKKVEKDNFPAQEFHYLEHKTNKGGVSLLKKVTYGKETLEIEYSLPTYEHEPYYNLSKVKYDPYASYKVTKIYKNGILQASFEYKKNSTTVTNNRGIKTIFCHNHKTLSNILRFDKENNLYSQEVLTWNKIEGFLGAHSGFIYFEKGLNKELTDVMYDAQTALQKREVFDKHDTLLLTTEYEYDEYKNLTKETTYNDFEKQSRSYLYDNKHRLIEENNNNLITKYQYHKDTILLTCKQIGDHFEYYTYDDHLLLCSKKIVAKDLTLSESYLRDPITHMIVEKDDGLQKVFYEYNEKNQQIKESTEYGSTEFSYDKWGNICSKQFPLGAIHTYDYDVYGNLLRIKETGSLEKNFVYDINNLPISCTINGRTSYNSYDPQGNLLKEVNYKGAITFYEYDEFSRCIKKTLPEVKVNEEFRCPTYQYEYDIFSNITKTISPLGYETSSSYNINNQPQKTTYPNGSFVEHTYNPLGNITKTMLQDGSSISFTYDEYGRCTNKQMGSFEEQWQYDGILLKSYTDQRGLTTTYEYDEYGRKIESDFEGRKKNFYYDEMGNICLVKEGELEISSTYDIEGKEIETTQNGFHHICYEYNVEGKKVRSLKDTSQGVAEDLFFYDEEGNFCKHTSPTGEETFFIFDDWSRTEIDPLGNKTIEFFDSHDRVVQIKKLSPDDEVLFQEEIFYDLEGNISKKITEGLVLELFHDCMGNIIKEVESGSKTTSYKFNKKDQMVEKNLPNGTIFHYEYDLLARRTSMTSSDGSTNYEYFYNGLDLVEIKDRILGKSLQRAYTPFGELCEEKGFFDLTTHWTYDSYGRKKSITLPDESFITYEYDKSCMNSVARYNKEGKQLYCHQYTKFDVNQHVEEEILPMNLGSAKGMRNLLELPTSFCSPFHKIELTFNGNHLVTTMKNSLTGNKDYNYDPLSQLIKEGEEAYAFDALGNSKEFEMNDLNQIVSSEDEIFIYDENGNLLSRKGISYKYDALDRLIKISYDDGREINLTYDPLSRLVAKECDGNTTLFLYDKDTEIGATGEDGQIQQLKVLGLGVQGDIGAAIAIELEGEIFVPLHDLQGNVIALVNRRGKIEESYSMNAFGLEKKSSYKNPWRFSSKREVERLIFFGMRFYDPSLKRWLTPDPAGFIDSRNLYLFNLNSPINRLDQFGLFSQHYCGSYGTGTRASRVMSPEEVKLSQEQIDRYQSHLSYRGILFGPDQFKDQASQFAYEPEKLYDFTTKVYGNAMPKHPIYLVQNGVHTTFDQLESMGEAIHNVFPDAFVFVQYNQSMVDTFNTFEENYPKLSSFAKTVGCLPYYGMKFGSDIVRVGMEHGGYTSFNGVRTSHTLMKFSESLQKNCPTGTITCIPHSEAAINLIRAMRYMPSTKRDLAKKSFYGLSIAGASPLPDKLFIKAHTVYSTFDCITGWNKKNIPGEISVEKLQSRATSYNLIEDHGFLGPTYGHYINNGLSEYINKHFRGSNDHTTR